MSISKMKKLVLIAPNDATDVIIKKLISLRCIDIQDFSSVECSGMLQKKNYNDEIAVVENKIQKIDSVISALSKHSKKRIGLGNSRRKIDRDEFVSSGEHQAAGDVLEKAYSAVVALEAVRADKDAMDEANRLENEISVLARDLERLEILYDVEKTNLEVIKIKQKAAYSDTCTFIFGWMPRKSQQKVESMLSEMLCAYEITEPTEDETPPVRISNNIFTRSFEWITSGFGTPKYSSFDPTFIMSIFCFLAFGLMIHDVGYGLILTVLGLVGSRLLGMCGKIKSVFNMIGICGISSIIFGVILGGWFGNLPYAMMQNLLGIESAKELVPFFGGVWFKAIENPVYYLAICLGLGATQIIVGMIIKFVLLCREGKAIDAILDILPWWIVFAGIGIVFAVNLLAGLITIGAGILVILIFNGRDKKNVLARLGKGFLGVGKIVFFVIDLLGYLKIFVVGISVGIISYFVNLLGTLIGPTTFGYIVFTLVIILGHASCLCLAAPSAVVFAKRIQYVEFFKYFYTCGGEKFIPVEPCEKYTLDTHKKEKVEAV